MAFEKQFTPEQEVKLEDHINYKSQGFITPLGQDKEQRLAKSVDNKMFGTFTDTPLPTATRHFTQQDRELFGLKTNYFAIARQDKPILPKNATEQEYLQWQEKTDEIAFAQAIVSNFNYNVSQDQGKNKKLQEIVSKYGLAFDNLSKEDIEYIVSQEALKQWKDVTDNFGLPKETLLNDTVFWKYTTPEAYRYMATAYNQKFNDGLTGEFANAWNKQRGHRALDIRYKNGELDYDEYMQMSSIVDDRYSSKSAFDKVKLTDEQKEKLEDLGLFDDGQAFENVVGTIGGMVYPIVDNPYKSAGLAALATVASFIPYIGKDLSSMIMSFVWAGDTKDLLDAQGLAQVQSQNPNADREEVLEAISPYTTLGASLDVLSNSFILRGSKLLTPVTKAAQKTLVKLAVKSTKLANKATTNSVERVALKEKLFDASKYIVKPYLAQVVGETVSEGAQDALTHYGAYKYLGQESITKSLGVGLESAEQALIPSAVLVGLFNTPHSIALSNKIFRGQQAVNKAIDNAQTTELLANSSLAKNTPNVAEDIFNKANFGNVFLSTKNDINNVLHEQNIPIDTLPKKVQDAINNAKDGEEVKITTADLALCPENARRALSTIASDTKGGVTSSEAISAITPDKIEEFRQELKVEGEKNLKLAQQKLEIENQVAKDLREHSPSTSVKQNSFVARFTANFYSALAKTLGIEDVAKFYKDNAITFKVEDREVAGEAGRIMDLKNVLGLSDNGVVSLKKSSSFTTVMHETMHEYFRLLNKFAKDNEKIRENLQSFYKWAGITEPSDNNMQYQQEVFVHGFLTYLLTGKNFNLDIFKGASQLLKLMHSDFAYSALNAKTAQDKANYQKRNFENAYKFNGENKKLPEITSDFEQFVNTMFEGDVAIEEIKQDYPFGLDLENIDNDPIFSQLPSDDRTELKQKLAENIKKGENDTIAAIDSLNAIRAIRNLIIKDKTKAEEFITRAQELLDKTENAKDKQALTRLYNKLLKMTKHYGEVLEQAKKKLEKEDYYQFLKSLKAQGFKSDGLTPEQIKGLKSLGLINEETGTDFNFYATIFLSSTPNELGQRINAEVTKLGGDKAESFYKYLTMQPKLEDKAQKIAEKFLDKTAALLYQDKSAQIEVAFAKAHKAIGKVFIQNLVKLSKTSESAKEITENIKSIAKHDVSKMTLKQLNVNSFFTNARRALKRLKDSIAQGDLANSLTHSRNEYYWNTTAELSSNAKNDVAHRLVDLRKFVNVAKEKSVKTHDFMTTQLIKGVLQRLGVVSLKEKINLNKVFDDLIELNKDQEGFVQYFTELKETLSDDKSYFNTYFEDIPLADLLNIIKTLEDLRKVARINNAYNTNIRISNFEDMRQGLIDTLKTHKFKADDLVTEENADGETVGSMTPKAKTKFKSVAEVIRSYASYTAIPELEFEKLDRKEFGGYFQSLFQIVNEGVINYKEAQDNDVKIINQAIKDLGEIKRNPFDVNIRIKTVDNKGNAREDIKWRLGAKGTEYEGRTTYEVVGVILQIGTNYDLFLTNNIADNPAINADKNIKDKKAAQLAWKDELFKKEFIEKGIEQGFITDKVFDFCETIWKNFNDKLPLTQQTNLLTKGYTFKEIEHRKWHIDHGGIKRDFVAGYSPAFVQTKSSKTDVTQKDFNLQNLSKDFEENNLSLNATFTVDRKEGRSDKPISLDLVRILNQVAKMNAYNYALPAVYKVHRLLNDSQVKPLLDRVKPNFYKEVIEPWLYSCATLKTSTATDSVAALLGKASMRVSQALMFMNFNNVIQQIANLPVNIIKAGLFNTLKSCVYLNPLTAPEVMKRISKESKETALRFREMNDSYNEIFNEIDLANKNTATAKQKAKAYWDKSKYISYKYAMIFQHVFQNRLDVVSYMAGKERARQMGLSENEQIAFAEQCVRQTQAGFDIQNTPKIAKSHPLVKAFVQFGTYFYMMENYFRTSIELAWTQAGLTVNERLWRTFKVGVFGWIAVPLISEFVNAVIGQGDFFADDDDTEDQMYLRFTAAPFNFYAASKPIVGQSLNHYINTYTQGSSLVRTGVTSPIISVTENAIHAFTKGTDMTGQDARALAVGVSVMCPAATPFISAASRPISALYDISTGRVTPQNNYDLARYMLTGTPSPQSKNGR